MYFVILTWKAFDHIHVKLTQKGLEKSMVHVPHRKAPLSPSILLQFRAHLNLCDSAHLALWSAFPVGSSPSSEQPISSLVHLIPFSSHTSSGALLTVTRTKTFSLAILPSLFQFHASQDHLSVPHLCSSHCFTQSMLLLHTLSSHSQPLQTS